MLQPTPRQNLNNNLAYNAVVATQEDYDRIEALHATLDGVSEGFAKVREMLRSK